MAALAVSVIPGLPSSQTATALARAPHQAGRAYGVARAAVALTQPTHFAEPGVRALDHRPATEFPAREINQPHGKASIASPAPAPHAHRAGSQAHARVALLRRVLV